LDGVFWHNDIGFVIDKTAMESMIPDGTCFDDVSLDTLLAETNRLPKLGPAPVASWLLARLMQLPATNANATASGTNANATVNPDKTSSLTEAVCLGKNCSIKTPIKVLDSKTTPHRSAGRTESSVNARQWLWKMGTV
jgi:hypothetical protein